MTEPTRYGACSEVREDLSAYFDGELPPDDRELVDAHLRSCADCLRELNALKRVDDAYDTLDAVNAPEDFDTRVRQAVNAGKTAAFTPRRIVPQWAGPLVAVAAAAVVVFGGVVLLERQQSERVDVAMAPEVASSGAILSASAAEAQSANSAGASGGEWDSFTSTAESRQRLGAIDDGDVQSAAPDASDWREFVGKAGSEVQSVAAPGEGSTGAHVAANDQSRTHEGPAAASEPVATPAPKQTDPSEAGVVDRSAVLGEPPKTLSAERAEALTDAAKEAERNWSDTQSALEHEATRAEASGAVTKQVLRSFSVGADGTWYESGYQGETATPLVRGSAELRELMKKYSGFDWNRLLERRPRQVFELNGAWYDLEADKTPE